MIAVAVFAVQTVAHSAIGRIAVQYFIPKMVQSCSSSVEAQYVKQVCQPAVTTVTMAVSGLVSNSAMPSVKTNASVLPSMSSTVVTMVSSAVMSMAVTSPLENLPLPVCNEMG